MRLSLLELGITSRIQPHGLVLGCRCLISLILLLILGLSGSISCQPLVIFCPFLIKGSLILLILSQSGLILGPAIGQGLLRLGQLIFCFLDLAAAILQLLTAVGQLLLPLGQLCLAVL